MVSKSVSVSRSIVLLIVLWITAFSAYAQTTYFSRSPGGNWNSSSTWSTVAFDNATNTGSFPVAGDIVFIGGTGSIVTISGPNATFDAACASINIADNSTLNVGRGLSVSGATTVGNGSTGVLAINSTAGTKLFSGHVTINSGGLWNETVNEPIVFRDGITNNGTFTASTAVHTFNTNSQILSGLSSLEITNVTVSSAGVTLTNNGTLEVSGTLAINGGTVVLLNNGTTTVGTTLSGTGRLTQGAGATLNIGDASTITNMTATASGNTVNYTGGAQTIHNNDYFNLGLSGSGAKTLQAGTTSISGNFVLDGTATTTAVIGLNIDGNVSLGNGTTFTTGAFTHNVSGPFWTNNGTNFDGTGSTFVFDGAGQTIEGTSSTPFNNLSFTNSGTKVLDAETDITGTLSVASGVNVNLGTFAGGNSHSANMLMLGGALQISGLWGGTGSGAPNINTTFFAANTGTISVAAGDFTYYARNNGDWNNPGTWSTVGHASSTNAGTFPGATNFAVIGGNFTVTVAANAACANLSFDAGTAVTNTLTINSGNTLTVSGAVTIPQTISSGTNILNVGAGNLVAVSLAFTSGSPAGTGHRMNISTGTATISGNVTSTGQSGEIEFTDAGLMQLGGGFYTAANGVLTMVTGSTVEYIGSSAQTVEAHVYDNLTLSGTGNKTMGNSFTMTGNLFVNNNATFVVGGFQLVVTGLTTVNSGGTLNIAGTANTKTFRGLVSIANGGTWTNSANEAITFQGGITNNGSFTAGTGVHTFNTNSQILSGTIGFSIDRVTVTGAAVELTNNTTLTVNTALGGTGRITQGTLGGPPYPVLNIGDASTITNMTATAAGNTVNYTGGSQTVKNVNYANLGLSGGAKTLQVGTTSITENLTFTSSASASAVTGLTIGGNVDIASGTTFTAGAFTHNVGGNLINNGTFNEIGSIINFNGTAPQSISGSTTTTFNDLRLSGTGTKTFSAGTIIGNELSIDNGAIANLIDPNSYTFQTLVLAGALQGAGTWGSSASAAPPATQNDTFFSGDGVINVNNGGFTYYSFADGNWNTPGTWSTAGFGGPAVIATPGAGDYVIIGNGKTVIVTDNQVCQELLFDAGTAVTNTLSITTGNLSVAGPITIPQTVTSGENILSVSAGSLTGASLSFTASGGGAGHRLNIAGGTATIIGNITGIGTGSTVEFTGAGTLRVGGSMFTSTSGTLIAPSGIVEYNGSAQTIQALPYFSLTLSGSGNKTLAANTTISGDLFVDDNTNFIVGAVTLGVTGATTVGGGASGTLSITSNTGTKTFTDLVTISPNGTWNNTTEAVTFQGGIANNGTFAAGTGTQTFSAAQFLSGTLSISTMNVTGAGAFAVTNNGNLTVTTSLQGTDQLVQGSGAVLTIEGASTITTLNATASGNTVNFTRGGDQTINSNAYVNLGISGSGTKTLQAGTTSITGNLVLGGTAAITAVTGLTIVGNVTLGSGTNFTAGAFTHNVGGHWINNGAIFDGTGSTIELDGTDQEITGGSTTFYNLTLTGTGTKVFDFQTVITNALAINTGAVADFGSITTHTANRLILNGVLQNTPNQTWGSATSGADNQDNTFFLDPSTGLITVAVGGNNFYSRADDDWNLNTTWSNDAFGGSVAVGTPGINDLVFIGNGNVVTLPGAGTCSSLSFDPGSSGSLSIGSLGNLTISGTITIPRASAGSNILSVGAGTLTANGIAFESGTAGQLMTISTGTATINNSITGIGTSSTIQITDAGLLQVGGNMFAFGSGTLTSSTSSRVEYNGAAQIVQALTYQNLILSGSGSKTLTATTTIGGNLVVNSGVNFGIGAFTFTVNGTTEVNTGGTLSITSATGTKIFTGLVTVSTGATWSNTANEAVTFRDGITNNGTFNAGTGVHTFDTNSQELNGTLSISNVTVTGVVLTNNNTLTVSAALSGTGELSQGNLTPAILNIGGTSTINTLTATGTGNTVNYAGGAQTVRPIPYVNLGLSGSGIKTLQAGTNSITGNLVLSGTVSTTPAANLTIGGSITIGSGTTFTAGAFDHAIGGNWTNNGSFNNSSRRITFTGGASNKLIQGTAPTTFYDLRIGEGTANPDVQVDQTVNLVGEMTFDDDATFDADGPGGNQIFTLISTASGDARIGTLGGTADVTGAVTVQRYMDAEGKIYRYISTPVDNPTAEDLQGEIPITGPFTGSSFPPQTGCTNCTPCTGCVLNNTSMFV